MISDELMNNTLTVPQAIVQRRMIRNYTDEKLDDNTLNQMMELAGRAPSSFNVQPWKTIVVRNKEKLQELQEMAMNQSQVSRSAATIIIYSDMKNIMNNLDDIIPPVITGEAREERKKMLSSMFGQYNDKELEVWGAGQSYIFLAYMQLVIESMGWSSSSMLGFSAEKIKEHFKLPDHVEIPALIAIGKSNEDGYPTFRFPIEKIMKIVGIIIVIKFTSPYATLL